MIKYKRIANFSESEYAEDEKLRMKVKRSYQRVLNNTPRIIRKHPSLAGCVCVVLIFSAFLCFTRTSETLNIFKAINSGASSTQKTSLGVLVLSHRNAFERRERIRRTWASRYKHVYFMVSEEYCQYPEQYRISGTCKPNTKFTRKEDVIQYRNSQEEITAKLRNESNVVLLPTRDAFDELPDLVKQSYRWALKNIDVNWFVHIGDSFDVCLDAPDLEKKFDPNENTVMILLRECTSLNESLGHLTPFQCSLNHIVPRHVAEYLAKSLTDIFEYKDKNGQYDVQVVKSEHIKSHHKEDIGLTTVDGVNSHSAALVLDLCLEHKMNKCVDEISYTLSENPSIYLISGRFDIIVKMVYAYFYLNEKIIPDVITAAYLEHLRVWNNFKEKCFLLRDEWFDAGNKCKEKETSDDFVSSFHDTIDNVRKFGFNPNISRIPVDRYGHVNNGAHRLSAAVVLSKNASFEHHTYKLINEWGYDFFQKQGLSQKVSDLVMLEWMKIQLKLPELLTTVSIVSIFSNDEKKDEKMRDIVKEQCSKDNDILYEKSINITREGARQLISHMYGEQIWIEAKIKDFLSRYTEPSFKVLFLFIYTRKEIDLVKCKLNIRKLYNDKIFKSTAHIPDNLEENLILAEMILNPSSIEFLNYAHNARDCKLIAKEIAARVSATPIKTLPKTFIGRNDVMVDSGTVLGFFDLRKRTDVDLLFLGKIDKSILGNRHGLNVQAHAFKYNSISRERPWGQEHFGFKGTQNQYDLFYDTENYGYCYGIKFVSLRQLVRYKTKRNEPNKDKYDVDLVQGLLSKIYKDSPKSNSGYCNKPIHQTVILIFIFILKIFISVSF